MTFTSIRPCSPPVKRALTLTLSFLAVFGLRNAALSHEIFVSGLGSSWSQPLLANRPS